LALLRVVVGLNGLTELLARHAGVRFPA